ncbi:MAG: hypothetical protein ACOYXT_13530 [Bacteroidota bacterium]
MEYQEWKLSRQMQDQTDLKSFSDKLDEGVKVSIIFMIMIVAVFVAGATYFWFN